MKYHIDIKREFDSTWGIMEWNKEPTEQEMQKFVKEELEINDNPEYMRLTATKI